jgi:hypothetical protein
VPPISTHCRDLAWDRGQCGVHTAIVAAAIAGRGEGLCGALPRHQDEAPSPAIIHAAPDLAGDRWLERCHTDLAYAVLDGEAEQAARFAALVARHEMAALP